MNTVLVIDDDPGMRSIIRDMLQSADCQVLEAPNGVAGLPMYREHRPQLVITDILMPEKDGVETVRELRKIDPHVPIIAISGGGRAKYTQFLKIAREFGATETLEKPFRRGDLLAAVSRALGTA